jgi:iron complex outermembrane receptor protein
MKRPASRTFVQSLIVVLGVLILAAAAVVAQERTATLHVRVVASATPVENAGIVVNGVRYATDASGTATIAAEPGTAVVAVVKAGFVTATVSVLGVAGSVREVVVELVPQPAVEEAVTVVASTRTDRRLDDQPMRVEVLDREEIEEKMLMTPGDIVGEVGGLGLRQIPPMDLGQVEVIKGVASALYGAGAMGGVVNLLSRRPSAEASHEVLLNRSTRGATDAVAFLSEPLAPGWSASLLVCDDRFHVRGPTWRHAGRCGAAG